MFSWEFGKIFKKTYFLEQFRATVSAFWRSNNSKWYQKGPTNENFIWDVTSNEIIYMERGIHIIYIYIYIYLYIYIYIYIYIYYYI